MKHSPALLYLRDCYQADNREQTVLDLFGSKVQFLHFFGRTAEILSDELPSRQVTEETVAEAARTARLHRTEKELLFTTLFVVGRVPQGEGWQRLCAPLFSYPVTVDEDAQGHLWLHIDTSARRLNFPLLTLLASAHSLDPETVLQLADALPEGTLDRAALWDIAGLLETTFPGLDTEGLLRYPEELDGKELRRLRNRRAKDHVEVVFAGALGLLRRSVESRGVLSELRHMAEEEQPSPPVTQLLNPLLSTEPPAKKPPNKGKTLSTKPGFFVPAILSEAQQGILENAAKHALSVVIGPPGTGKSFTIAALTLDALARGETVLVASKMHHAVDVVADKIEHLLGIKSFVVRGGRRQYRKDLVLAIRTFLNGVLPVPPPEHPDELQQISRSFARHHQRLERLEDRLEARRDRELAWGRDTYALDQGAEGPKRLLLQLRAAWRGRLLASANPYWELMSSYQRTIEERLRQTAQWLRLSLRQRLENALEQDRPSLVNFRKALSARTVAKRAEYYNAVRLETLFTAFPVWMSNLAEVGEVVPPVRGLFDLVIVDEASQCDLASSLPLLHRGRRAVVVGDPQQLRHISFLSRDRQGRLAQDHGLSSDLADSLDYRDKSLLDLAADALPTQGRLLRLDEHFRSLPPIIAFSNREFYGDGLRIMKSRPHRAPADCLEYRRVPGKRLENGSNPVEAEALVEALLAELAEEAERPQPLRHTVGVLSPFRAQVDFISELLSQRLDQRTLELHDVRVGTPYAFQGEERDRMFLSLVLDADSHSAAFRFLDRADVFNVAVTRARSRQLVFGSLDPKEPKARALLRRFLEHLEAPPEPTEPPAPNPAADAFLNALRAPLEGRGFQLWPRYPIAGLEVDLVLEREGRCLGIDLVGHPGELAAAFTLERYRILERAGLRLFPLAWSVWRRDSEACLEAIHSAWQESTPTHFGPDGSRR